MKINIVFDFAFQVLILDAFESIFGSLEIWAFSANLFPMVDEHVHRNGKWSKGFHRAS